MRDFYATCEWWRQNRVFESWRSYFDLHIYEDASLEMTPNSKPVLYTFVPHGLFPFALALASGVLFKGKRIPIAIASSMFYIPVFGLLLRALGCVPADKALFESKQSFVLVPDGIAGVFYSDRQHERVFLRSRKGFVKHALQHGYDIVPVYCFGHTQLYDVYGLPELSRRLRFALMFFWGKAWLPHARPVSIVFGKQLVFNDKTTLDEAHQTYLDALLALYNKYKSVVPEWDMNKELNIV